MDTLYTLLYIINRRIVHKNQNNTRSMLFCTNTITAHHTYIRRKSPRNLKLSYIVCQCIARDPILNAANIYNGKYTKSKSILQTRDFIPLHLTTVERTLFANFCGSREQDFLNATKANSSNQRHCLYTDPNPITR